MTHKYWNTGFKVTVVKINIPICIYIIPKFTIQYNNKEKFGKNDTNIKY
jgi:hypothetical protein